MLGECYKVVVRGRISFNVFHVFNVSVLDLKSFSVLHDWPNRLFPISIIIPSASLFEMLYVFFTFDSVLSTSGWTWLIYSNFVLDVFPPDIPDIPDSKERREEDLDSVVIDRECLADKCNSSHVNNGHTVCVAFVLED